MYAYLLAIDYALLGVSVLVFLPFLIGYLKLTDCKLIIVGLSFRIVRLVTLSFSRSTFEVFLSTILGAPSALIVSCCKASISKVVEDDERGKVFALISCAETVAILAGSIIFVSVYNSTKNFFPGSIFIFEAMFFVCMLVMIYMVSRDIKEVVQYDDINKLSIEGQQERNPPVPQSPSKHIAIPATASTTVPVVHKSGDVTNELPSDQSTTLISKKPHSKNPFYNPDLNN